MEEFKRLAKSEVIDTNKSQNLEEEVKLETLTFGSTTSVQNDDDDDNNDNDDDSDESLAIASAVASILEGITSDHESVVKLVKSLSELEVPRKHSKKKHHKSKRSIHESRSSIRLAKKSSKTKLLSSNEVRSNKIINLNPGMKRDGRLGTIDEEERQDISENEPQLQKVESTTIQQVKEEDPTTAVKGTENSVETKKVTGPIQKIPPPLPLPKIPNQLEVNIYLGRINTYINKLGYHRVGEPSIRVITHLSLRHHMETARQIIKASENIKCLHALLLGIYFTNCTPIIERFPINFKSKFNAKEYRHVVLGIYLYGAYGALGISRDPGLQDKSPQYPRFSELLADYVNSYAQSGHILLEIKIGGVISRDTTSQVGIPWKIGEILHMNKFVNAHQFAIEADKISRLLKVQMGPACIRHIRPPEMIIPKCLFDDAAGLLEIPGTTTANLIGEKTKLIGHLRAAAIAVAVKSTPSSSTHSTVTDKFSPPIGPKSTTKPKKKKVLKHKRFPEP